MVVEREEDQLVIRWPRSRGALFGFSVIGLLFLSIGTLALVTGQHFPHISAMETCLWSYLSGVPCFLLGLCFLGNKRMLTFAPDGLKAYFSRWRFIEWQLHYKRKHMEAIYIEPHRSNRLSRVIIQIKGQADLEVARHLDNEYAWQIGTILAELTALPIRGR